MSWCGSGRRYCVQIFPAADSCLILNDRVPLVLLGDSMGFI